MKNPREWAEKAAEAYDSLYRIDTLAPVFEQALADARRAALEEALTAIEAVYNYADSPPEDERVAGLSAALGIVRALLDAAPKPEEATRFPPAVVCRKRTMDPSYPCTCSVCSVKP